MLKRLLYLYKKFRLRNLVRDYDYSGVEFQLIRKILEQSSKPAVSVDIGANYGIYTAFLAQFCNQVIACEPVPLSFKILNDQLKKFETDNVQSHQVALSDKEETRNIYIPVIDGTTNYYRAGFEAGSKQNGYSVDVTCTTLDNLLNQINECTFIKLDVEGHELPVIRGGKQVLKNFYPCLLIEMNTPPSRDNTDSFKILEELNEMDYICFYQKSTNRYNQWTDSASPQSVNYFFLPRKFITSAGDSLQEMVDWQG